MRGWTVARGGRQRKYTHHRIKGEQDRGVEEERRWREGGREGERVEGVQ